MAILTIGGRRYEVEIRGQTVSVDGHEFAITRREDGGSILVTVGGVPYRVALPAEGERGEDGALVVQVDHRPYTVESEGTVGSTAARKATVGAAARAASTGGIKAPIAGRVLSVKVKVGDQVKQGDLLLILEARKRENEVRAPADGVVKEIAVAEGARVSEGETLVVFE